MRFRFLILSVLILANFSSCAYFNTYFNTKKYFDEAKKEREKRQGDKPSSKELQSYDKAIEKASKILELHPNSKYVDDAVMILGKCFYYKGDYVRAHRKFQELITFFPDSPFYYEAKLWMAKTIVEENDYATAELILKEVQGAANVDKNVLQQSSLLLGDILHEQEKYNEAIEKYKQAAQKAKNQNIRSKAYLNLGETQVETGAYNEAAESFRRAIKNSPDKTFEYDAEMKLGSALKLAGDYEQSIKICTSLLDNQLMKDRHGWVKFEIADCTFRSGRAKLKQSADGATGGADEIQEALDQYEKITNEYKRTEVSAAAHFEMGKIYEQTLGDFTKAKEHYEQVKTEFSRSQYVDEANKKARSLGDLIKLQAAIQSALGKEVGQTNSSFTHLSEMEILLLEQGVDPEFRFMQRQKKLAQEKGANGVSEETPKAKDVNVDELIDKKFQLAQHYLFEFSLIDSAMSQYHQLLADYPNHPIIARVLYSMAFIYENEYLDKAKTDSLLKVVVDRFPDSVQARAARKKLGLPQLREERDYAKEQYLTAEKKLFNEHEAEQALAEYQQVIDRYPESTYAAKAYYAMGWIYEKKMHANDKAIEVYRDMLEKYPQSEFSKKIKQKLTEVEKAAAKEQAEQKAESASISAKPDSMQTIVAADSTKKVVQNEQESLSNKKPAENKNPEADNNPPPNKIDP